MGLPWLCRLVGDENRLFNLLKKILITLFILIVVSGCSSQPTPETVTGPSVTSEQAEELAMNEYGITKIEKIELRHLTESELNNLSDEQLELTPVYFVITGLIEKEKVTVYVSSNEINHHFTKRVVKGTT